VAREAFDGRERNEHLAHVGALIERDGLEKVVALDALSAGRAQEHVDVLHLLKRHGARVGRRARPGAQRIHELAQDHAALEPGLEVGANRVAPIAEM
jgi:hypothetical protein